MPRKAKQPKQVTALKHDDAKRPNIPTAELQPVMPADDQTPIQVAYERRNRDLDPQLVWSGKDQQDAAGLTVQAPPLFIQEKVHPQVLIRDLMRTSGQRPVASDQGDRAPATQIGFADLFADFNGLEGDAAAKTEFYQHDANWTNRMILGDSLQVMASLAEREGLRGKVQCIYIDPPYGIKFNSNFQWSTTSRDVKDGNAAHITREPEQVKAFRDTWRHGVHSYLSYLRDRLEVARDLLADSGSIFVQIGDENVHRVRAIADEVFGEGNFCSLISYKTSVGLDSQGLDNTANYLVWYCKNKNRRKFRPILRLTKPGEEGASRYKTVQLQDLTEYRVQNPALEVLPDGARLFRDQGMTSRTGSATTTFSVRFRGRQYSPTSGGWRTGQRGFVRVVRSDRILPTGNTLSFRKFFDDFSAISVDNIWADVSGGVTSRSDPKVYVVQTGTNVIQRCLLMASDPGDLVLDPTCGSGTTAYVAEQWGRRWITIDTSRVALALARARVMGARYPYYLLADSPDGRRKEAEISGRAPVVSGQGSVASDQSLTTDHSPLTTASIRQGFVYERVPHITLKSIANNAEIDVIWELYEERLAPLRAELSAASGRSATLEEWEIPRERPEDWPPDTDHWLTEYWELRIERQREIDASIAAKADYEYLYDKPYTDNRKVRVAGPFTVESLSPHRTLGVDENDELIDGLADATGPYGEPQDFASMILENLKSAGVQQAHVEDRISFTSLTPWPGQLVCAEGRYVEGGDADAGAERRAAIFIGPEFGTVSRPDLVQAAREAAESGFDVLIACAFSYEATAAELDQLGRIPVLKARMNADLHMAADLKATGKGNLFVIFGEPDIDILDAEDGQVRVRVNGVDVFHPNSGEVRSDGPDGIACWFVDTDYNEESFFVRHAYFLGQNDPYKSLKTTLKAEIDAEAWETLHSATSRPFDKPESGRIAVKVINHLGDEVMKVFRVG